jgi:hypothetical protein
MGIWTQADVDSIKVALASGLLTVSYSGPPARSVMYQSTKQLMELLAMMQADLDDTAGTRTKYRLAVTRRGL